MIVIDKIPSCRKIRIKGYIQKWLDCEVLQKRNARDKLFRKFKKSRINIDKEFNKKVKQMPQNWSQQKKQAFFEEKLSETIGKPKDLWESLKSLVKPSKTAISSFNATEEGNTLSHDTCLISKFSEFSSYQTTETSW